MNDIIKTKFPCYIHFRTKSFDTTPEKEDESGVIKIPTVTLDGDFTYEDLKLILIKFSEFLGK